MNKKILSSIVLSSMLFSSLSVFADSIPNFPMSVWGTVKNWETSITDWIVQAYNWTTKLGEIAILNWQYGWNTAFDNKITLNQFVWNISFKIVTWWQTYTASGITNVNSDCPSVSAISFVSKVCQYNLNINWTTASTVITTSWGGGSYTPSWGGGSYTPPKPTITQTWATNTWNMTQSIVNTQTKFDILSKEKIKEIVKNIETKIISTKTWNIKIYIPKFDDKTNKSVDKLTKIFLKKIEKKSNVEKQKIMKQYSVFLIWLKLHKEKDPRWKTIAKNAIVNLLKLMK